jgi:hypothetical protein
MKSHPETKRYVERKGFAARDGVQTVEVQFDPLPCPPYSDKVKTEFCVRNNR